MDGMKAWRRICGGGEPPEREDLDVLVANVYAYNRQMPKDLALMKSLAVDVVGVSEGWRLPRVKPWGFRMLRDDRGGRGSKEVPVLVRRSRATKVVGFRVEKVAAGIEGSRVAKPRWVSIVRLRTRSGRKVSILNTHMHAAIVDKSGRPYFGSRRVAQYALHMLRLLELVEEERADGFEPIVTGDLNYPPRGDAWKWSPEVALARVGLKWKAVHLDGLGFDPEVFRLREFERIDSIGSDHPHYALARLRWR